MKVGIIGAGSIGLLFAAYISRVSDVVIYTRTQEQAVEINKNGILLRKGPEESIALVKALPISEWQGTEELTIIAVKQYQLPAIIEKLNHLSVIPECLLFLQNGMGHLKLFKGMKANNLYVGSVEHGALKENSFTVSHNGEGVTNVAAFQGETASLQYLAEAFVLDFPIVFQKDFYDMLMKKLIVNAVINPLTAILYVKNGELIENRFYFKVVKNLFAEISFILNLEYPDEYLQLVVDICKKTASNRSSMLKDIEANRLTEVDAILGFLLEEAKRQDKEALQIESIYYLIKGKESHQEEVL
ncbi:2-dehydropantoate 2-reductase [Neobacillus sp. WH10]|uniref:2-dehydropantoate 2-reductase n=1 Tax=Neobacillus sp. WH10 TaxID=3047873 RepID=UPI0024C17161|nr:2-dehydropantoate 2-reductase [Neobacillus sp. WH10]WHY79236.1 2-dehydropantoate 2-reductase [Neobacillus sp. WH10]